MVKTYVNIENIRFDEQIVLYISDFEKIKSIKVPKFSVQLLVENAIKHGFYNIYEGGVIRIEVFEEEEKITFIVYNNYHLQTSSNFRFLPFTSYFLVFVSLHLAPELAQLETLLSAV